MPSTGQSLKRNNSDWPDVIAESVHQTRDEIVMLIKIGSEEELGNSIFSYFCFISDSCW